VPVTGVAVVVLAGTLSATGLVATEPALAVAIVAALALLAFIGLRPLLTEEHPARVRTLGALLGVVWLFACYIPFHYRIYPGVPLVAGAQLTASGAGLPLRIPAAGHGAVDLLLETHLVPGPTQEVATPVHFTITIAGADGTPQVVTGLFEDTLATRRLGRRGSAVVHQMHSSEMRVLSNPGRGDLTISQVLLEPENSQPVTITAFAHPLPPLPILALAVAALLGAVIAFDRRGPGHSSDGALTIGTATAVGTALIFWTSDAVHPEFQTFIGAAIFGGPLGFGAGALVWWLAKRFIARPD